MFNLIKKFNKKTIGDSSLFLVRIMALIVFVAIIAATINSHNTWEKCGKSTYKAIQAKEAKVAGLDPASSPREV